MKWEVWSPLNNKVAISSNEYIRCPVVADSAGTIQDPTAYTVNFAFLSSAVAEPTTWVAGSWDVTAIGGYVAQCLSGTGGAALTPGSYFVWVQIIAGAETVVQPAGEVQAY